MMLNYPIAQIEHAEFSNVHKHGKKMKIANYSRSIHATCIHTNFTIIATGR